jgi:hypothetical protein
MPAKSHCVRGPSQGASPAAAWHFTKDSWDGWFSRRPTRRDGSVIASQHSGVGSWARTDFETTSAWRAP